MKPSVEPVRVAETGQVAPRADERLLDRVARELRVAEDQAGGRVQPREMRVDERGEGVMLALPRSFDQLSLVRSATKWCTAITTVQSLGPTLEKAIEIAESGVPGPVFLEVPVDVLYPEAIVREWYFKEAGAENAQGVAAKALEGMIPRIYGQELTDDEREAVQHDGDQ